MSNAVIVSTARTPLAKSWRGAFNMTHGATLGGHAVKHAIARAGIEASEVEDVIMGCANPEGATGANIARQIALMAECPVTVSGLTINRFCSSGLQTIALASQRIIAGEGEVYVAGGVESISCVQQEMNTHMLQDLALAKMKPEIYWNMLQTAEQVAHIERRQLAKQEELVAEYQQADTVERQKAALERTAAVLGYGGHQVLNGKMSCGDCHDPHEGRAIKGAGAAIEAANETCTKCHTSQKGPFIFAHNAMKEGCVACHSPHGSVNAKLLVARDANLCLRCHVQTTDRNGTIFVGGEDHRTRLQNGTCWSAGCHEAVHGSNASKALRY